MTLEQAQARMDVVARQLATAYPDAWTDVTKQGRRVTLLPERETRIPPQVRGPALGFVALLMGTVALVLLVCCANVAGLLLARAAGRLKEVGHPYFARRESRTGRAADARSRACCSRPSAASSVRSRPSGPAVRSWR